MLLLVVSIFYSVYLAVLSDCPVGFCQPNNTCCPERSPGEYGCCQLPNAVCCSDGLHCCPEGTECALESGECRSKESKLKPYAFTKRQGLRVVSPGDEYKAAINQCVLNSYCPDSYTCCVDKEGDHTCCPPKSTCCPNTDHCCPEGAICDLASGICHPDTSKHVPYSFLKRQGTQSDNADKINRGCDNRFCPHEHSCCVKPNGFIGCCPFSNAVCCRDRFHCCPEGSRCESTSDWCIIADSNNPPVVKEESLPLL